LLPRLFWRAARIGGVWVYALVAGPLTIDVTSAYFRRRRQRHETR
jgi:hypothetical protein